ncbi:MAG: hypothetical protein JWP12_2352 [Bacteroidetes bacterium]|nr:hypothetical protein [Bacteroidota bacterium]
MKKQTLFLAFIIFAGITMTSCRKEYNCTCVVTDSSGTKNTYETNITASKKKKQSECDATAPDSDFGKTCTVN